MRFPRRFRLREDCGFSSDRLKRPRAQRGAAD
jgi:hypothetical protein